MKHDLNLAEMYGPNFEFNFSAHTRNIATGTTMNRGHHCPVCSTSCTKRCYNQLHLAFCTAPLSRDEGQTDICGERFLVKSPTGCSTHKYRDGFNRQIVQAYRGLDTGDTGYTGYSEAESCGTPKPESPDDEETPELAPVAGHRRVSTNRDVQEAETEPSPAVQTKNSKRSNISPKEKKKGKKGKQTGGRTAQEIVRARRRGKRV